MGQKCCSPAMALDPKHMTLLTLIYSQPLESVKETDYQIISSHLSKKGYIKTLADYLSSHLKQINPSLITIRNRQFSARNKNIVTQIFISVITTETTQKITALCKQIKQKQQDKYRKGIAAQQQIYEHQHHHYRQDMKASAQKHMKIVDSRKETRQSSFGNHSSYKNNKNKIVYNLEFLQVEVVNSTLEIAAQIIRQSIHAKNQLALNINSKQKNTIENTIFTVIYNFQVILSKIFQDNESIMKVDFRLPNDLLDNLISILMMSCTQNPNFQTKTNTYTHSQAPQVRNSTGSQKLISNSDEYFCHSSQQKHKLALLTLGNYYNLIHSTNVHLSNDHLHKDTIKTHLPKLFEYWADLMIFSEQHSRISDFKQEKMEVQDDEFDKKMETQSQFQKNNIDKNIQIIQLIILQYFNSYFSFGESQYVYRQLIIIFDRLNFSKAKISPIQNLVFEALKRYELRESAISKWFQYLLDYLGAIITSSGENSLPINNFNQNVYKPIVQSKQEANYFREINLQINFENLKIDNKNWHKEQNIQGCLKTIKRWIHSGQIDLQNVLNYKRLKLFVSVLVNLARGQRRINQQIHSLLQYLIDSDVRCFGYLIDTSLFLIKKLRINILNFQTEWPWQFYQQKWGQKKTNEKQTKKEQIIQKQISKSKLRSGSLSVRIKSLKNSEANVELIPIDEFIDLLIFTASFPYLNKIVEQMKQEKQIYEHQSQQKNFVQKDKVYSSGLKIKRTMSIVISESDESVLESPRFFKKASDNILDRQKKSKIYLKSTKAVNSGNILFFKSVFHETLSIILKGLSLHSKSTNMRYQIKLTGLIISANLQNMISLSSMCSNRKQLSYVYGMVAKINKFLSKINKQMRCSNLQSTDSQFFQQKRISSEQQADSFDQIQSSFRNDIEPNTNDQSNDNLQKTDPFKNREYYQKNQMLSINQKAVRQWIYPAFQSILSSITNISNKKLQKSIKFETWEQIQIQNKNNLKILFNICIKLYFKNMLSLIAQIFLIYKRNINIFKQNNSSLLNSQLQAYQNQFLRQNLNIFTNIFQLFISFYNFSLKLQSQNLSEENQSVIQKSKLKKSRNPIKRMLSRKRKKTVSQKIELKQQQRGNQLIEDIFFCDKNLHYFLNHNFSFEGNQIQSIFLPEGFFINFIQQTLVKEEFCSLMFQSVDDTSNYYKSNLLKPQKITQVKTQQIIDHELLKVEPNEIDVQRLEDQGRCSLFKKAKKKFTKNVETNESKNKKSPKENQVMNQQKPEIKDPVLFFSEISENNAHEVIPQLVAKLSESYMFPAQLLKSTAYPKTIFNNGNQKTHFSLTGNDFQRKQSAHDSSGMKQSNASSTYKQIVQQIRMH